MIPIEPVHDAMCLTRSMWTTLRETSMPESARASLAPAYAVMMSVSICVLDLIEPWRSFDSYIAFVVYRTRTSIY